MPDQLANDVLEGRAVGGRGLVAPVVRNDEAYQACAVTPRCAR